MYFDNNSYFNRAEIGNPFSTNQQKTIFYESRFDGDANFSNVHFNNVNEFIDLCFLGETSFYSTEFADDTYFVQNPGRIFALNKFTSPKYDEKTNFSEAKFKGKLHFENIEFNDGVDFIETIFYKESNFENIQFNNSSPDFKDAEFVKMIFSAKNMPWLNSNKRFIKIFFNALENNYSSINILTAKNILIFFKYLPKNLIISENIENNLFEIIERTDIEAFIEQEKINYQNMIIKGKSHSKAELEKELKNLYLFYKWNMPENLINQFSGKNVNNEEKILAVS